MSSLTLHNGVVGTMIGGETEACKEREFAPGQRVTRLVSRLYPRVLHLTSKKSINHIMFDKKMNIFT
ncbi:MAG: hypothetical protein Q6373_005335 [Candidatus Sigynarchaeota archaeon]